MRYLAVPLLLLLAARVGYGCATPSDPYNYDTGTADVPHDDATTDFADSTFPDIPDTPFDPATDPLADPTYDTDSAVDPGGDPVIDPSTDDVAFETPTGGVVGDACYSATQCSGVPGSGRTCLTNIMGYITFPGGYCSATCTSAADCGAGGACVNLMDLGQYCLETCTSAAQCRTAETYTCSSVSGASGLYCIPPVSTPES